MKRNKAQRMMILYQKLSKGDYICKSTFCMEYEIEEWTFDRYITDIRNLLSENFSLQEVMYDRKRDSYFLKNPNLKPEIELGGSFILAKLLLSSRILCTADQAAIVEILLSQLRPEMRERARTVLRRMPELLGSVTGGTVKLVEDLLSSIEYSHRITLCFNDVQQSSECVPYSVEFQNQALYLAAWELCSGCAILYPLEDIQSYVTTNEPYSLSFREQETLQQLIAKLCNKELDDYQPYIYHKEEQRKNDSF